jgi:hypothetical protein
MELLEKYNTAKLDFEKQVKVMIKDKSDFQI